MNQGGSLPFLSCEPELIPELWILASSGDANAKIEAVIDFE